jgi:beta-lactam-binding protein with PASTA domain
MGLSTRVWTVGKVLMLAAALVGTYLLFLAASMRVALRAREVVVPDLTTRAPADAAALSLPLGLTIKVDETARPDATIAEGRVVTQDPAPGAVARRQRSVRVWLSAGTRAAVLPQLGGESERTAQVRAAQSGLQLVSTSEIRSPAFDADIVVAQDPQAKAAGPRVALLVNRRMRNDSYVMPDLIGTVGERASDALRRQGMRVAIVATQPYPGAIAGTVLRQSPAAGFQVGLGEAISLEVSR